MIRLLIRNWWLLALRGILALIFAGLALALQPLSRSFVLRPIIHAGVVVVFGLLAIAAGVCTIVAATRGAGGDRFHLLLWDGIAICAAGLVVLFVSWLDLALLVNLVAAWALVVGILEFLAAMRLRRHVSDEWSLALAGTASFLFGAYFLYARPEAETSIFHWLGLYAVFSGLTVLILAFRLRSLGKVSHHLAQSGSAD
ncbi:MAG TPA: DUF308 domain-containing protein [Candidatus Angelobacter sp.]|nr:DUF308 domain-containing protein [Candidatus Angelobacter sp.]